MNKTIENLKNGNYSVVDNQGVSVTEHFIDCLEKEFADLEAKLTLTEKALELACDTAQFEDTCDYCRYDKEVGCPCYCETDQHFSRDMAVEYFKNQAKEMK